YFNRRLAYWKTTLGNRRFDDGGYASQTDVAQYCLQRIGKRAECGTGNVEFGTFDEFIPTPAVRQETAVSCGQTHVCLPEDGGIDAVVFGEFEIGRDVGHAFIAINKFCLSSRLVHEAVLCRRR